MASHSRSMRSSRSRRGGNSLAAVGLTDIRLVQPANPWLSAYSPSASIAFPDVLPRADYAVHLEVAGATNPAAVGTLTVVDKARNGFRIVQTGSADNVRITWTVFNPGYR